MLARHETTRIDALTNDVLLDILERAAAGNHYYLRAVMPLVCKRWRDAICAKGSRIFSRICFNYDNESRYDKSGKRRTKKQRSPSTRAVAQWVQKKIRDGNIEYPCEFQALFSSTKYAQSRKALTVLLAAMEKKLHCLWVHGSTGGLLDDFKFHRLWTVPNLRQLYLSGVEHKLDQEEFESGIVHLRHLELFHLSGREGGGFSSFPLALCSLTHMTSLTFKLQNLGRLPRELSELVNLRNFGLREGSIGHAEEGHLPLVLGQLTSLRDLELRCSFTWDNAKAGDGPGACQWEGMSHLTRLILEGAYGSPPGQLPPEVAKLSELVQLVLIRPGGLTDQLELSFLNKLKDIVIQGQAMIRMPDWIGSLPKLSALQLYGVRLKEWSLSGFQSLRRLDVLSCNARKVANTIGQLTGLTSLSFSECPLEELDSKISCLHNLRHLALEGSYFSEFPSTLHALRAPYLRTVRLEAHQGWQGTLRPLRVVSPGKAYSAMPVAAGDLAWLLQHHRLEGVTISATKAEAAALRAWHEDLTRVCGRDILTIELCN